MAKATVQAALGPVILRRLTKESNGDPSPEKTFAEIIQLVCVLSIVVTAPIGAILISITGPRLLTKTKPIQNVEGNVTHDIFIGLKKNTFNLLFPVCRLASQSSSIIV